MKPTEKYNQLLTLLSSFTKEDAQHFYKYELDVLLMELERTQRAVCAKKPRKEIIISEYTKVVELTRKEFLLAPNFMERKVKTMFSTTPKQVALKILKERVELHLGEGAKWRFLIAREMGINIKTLAQHLQYADKKMSKSPFLVKRYNRIKSML